TGPPLTVAGLGPGPPGGRRARSAAVCSTGCGRMHAIAPQPAASAPTASAAPPMLSASAPRSRQLRGSPTCRPRRRPTVATEPEPVTATAGMATVPPHSHTRNAAEPVTATAAGLTRGREPHDRYTRNGVL